MRLKAALAQGYAELTPSSVINATRKLLDEEGQGKRP
jgi:hypothetical protein